MPVIIKAEHLSKAYQLGETGTASLSRDLQRTWARVRGHEDPFLIIGETTRNDTVWSLKDVNFEINQGDAVGIIGRNGAGKSTLLKVLSRVTAPTKGVLKVRGRIASLLEVGTGFHPELTGRENIFLNGAILGMRKSEIRQRFDEIVDFAGVERYIDTPVKRYSSGMYVRLAFGVAAHLESDILIVDEVLAVGDAEFQKKCLGKMGDVSKSEGRTVLFVSHNMGSVRSLCSTAMMLDNGEIVMVASAESTINHYLKKNNSFKIGNDVLFSKCKRFQLERPYWTDAADNFTDVFTVGERIVLNFNFIFNTIVPKINPGFAISDLYDNRIFTSHLNDDERFQMESSLSGNVKFKSTIDLPLAPGTYRLVVGVRDEFDNTVIYTEDLHLLIEGSVAKNGANGILWYTSSWTIAE